MEQRRHTLLIVDDEVDVLESLRHQFHRTYKVLTAGSGSQAVSVLDANEVQLILSDQRMPGMQGDSFLSQGAGFSLTPSGCCSPVMRTSRP